MWVLPGEVSHSVRPQAVVRDQAPGEAVGAKIRPPHAVRVEQVSPAEPLQAQGPEINDVDGKPIFHANEEAGDGNE